MIIFSRLASRLSVCLMMAGLLTVATACHISDDVATAGDPCDEEGATEGNLVCQEGSWVVDDADADRDTGPDAECDPETDRQFCDRLGAECGEIVDVDNCDQARSVDCGAQEGLGCGRLGNCLEADTNDNLDTNICTCPEVDFDADETEVCDELDADCGSVDPAEMCIEWDSQDPLDCGECDEGECGLAGDHVCGCPCEIDGGCQDVGDVSPGAPCQVCDPDVSETDYTEADDGTECADNAVCDDGDCVCDDETMDCDGDCIDVDDSDEFADCDGQCIDLTENPDHCGGCNQGCSDVEVCDDGDCVDNCPEDQTACDGTCVDTETDDTHCGGCNTDCGADESCVDGDCIECADDTDCDDNELCDDAVCVCPEPTCGPDDCGTIANACGNSTDCGGCDGCQTCQTNVCADDDAACDADEECNDGTCQCTEECCANDDCDSDEFCSNNQCVECIGDSDCNGNDLCYDNECVECTSDDHCSGDEQFIGTTDCCNLGTGEICSSCDRYESYEGVCNQDNSCELELEECYYENISSCAECADPCCNYDDTQQCEPTCGFPACPT